MDFLHIIHVILYHLNLTQGKIALAWIPQPAITYDFPVQKHKSMIINSFR
jgi:hypothetical protein